MPIPANALVNVIPSVLSAGGAALTLNGLVLTANTRVPYGTVLSFPSLAAVQQYFGAAAAESQIAAIYFSGFSGCTQYPSALFFTQYPTSTFGVAPYLRGGSVASLTLAQLQQIAAGTMTITINGTIRTSGSISLAGAVSFSNAAQLIQSAFGSYDAVTGTGATIAAGVATTFAGNIVGNILTVVTLNSGALVVGGVLSGTGGGGITAGTQILTQLTGTAGGVGTYTVSPVQQVSESQITQNYGLLNTNGTLNTGFIAAGQVLSGTGTLANGTFSIGSFVSGTAGTGGPGTYVVSGGTGSYNFGAGIISLGQLLVTYDSVSGGFIFTGGTPGVVGTITFASGAIGTSLNLTQTTGAVLSQGAAAGVPGTFMSNLVATLATNWATFMTVFNPDTYGNANKLLFAAWNATQNNRFAYICWDTDVTPTLSTNAASCLGQLLNNSTISGTVLVYDPLDTNLAAFCMGLAASTNFGANAGRITWAYKAQSGLTLTVTNQTVAANLIANGYNFYGQYSTNNQLFNFFQPGQISPYSTGYLWADSYINQIWLNAGLQLALLNLLQNSNSIPYNPPGLSSIEAAIAGFIVPPPPAIGAVANGVISAGVNLSANQVVEVNTAAGLPIAGILGTQGWFAQVLQPTAQVRAARTTPPCNFWYTDGGSVQQITLASIEVQ